MSDLDEEGVATWIQTVIKGDLGKQYAAGLRDGLIDSDGMDSFPVGGDELTEYGIEKKHCRAILAKWGKRKSAAAAAGTGAGAGASVPAVAPAAPMEVPMAAPMTAPAPAADPKVEADAIARMPMSDALPQYIVFCGNPGTGKSTWLNGICGKELFKSGFSAGSGLTQAVQTEEATIPFEGKRFKIVAGDTPGLKDAKTQEQCGEEIRKALERSKETNSALRLIFFFTL
jgi:hypothetical protein